MSEREQLQNLTDAEEESIRHRDYPTAPIVFDAATALNSGIIRTKGKSAILRFSEAQALRVGREVVTVGPSRIYDLVGLTVDGLNEATAKAGRATIVRDAFLQELGGVKDRLDRTLVAPIDCGSWVYYPRNRHLVHFADEYWHRMALTLTTSVLYLDPEMQMSFFDVRKKFENSTVAIMGLSVGNRVKEAIHGILRSKNLIIGDKRNYKMPNANRVNLSYEDLVLSNAERAAKTRNFKRGLTDDPDLNGMRYKWQVAAEQVHRIDPYVNIFCYPGMDESNFDQVLHGNRIQPKPDAFIEVSDTNVDKVEAAAASRDEGIMFVRGTDAGSQVWADFYRYDEDKSLPLAYVYGDATLRLLALKAGQSFDDFERFVNAVVGEGILAGDNEFTRLIKGKLPQVSTSVPQDTATPMGLGALLGHLVPRAILGHKVPKRTFIDLNAREVKLYGP